MKICDIIGHNYNPYEYLWIEFLPDRNAPVNREGTYKLKTVYCSRCGEIKTVNRNGDKVYYGYSD